MISISKKIAFCGKSYKALLFKLLIELKLVFIHQTWESLEIMTSIRTILSFKRLPDPDGLRYWISNFTSGKDDERVVASSFLASAEFKQRYGENVSNESYVDTLYKNILGRDYDQAGYSYWLGNLNNGVETRYELLLRLFLISRD